MALPTVEDVTSYLNGRDGAASSWDAGEVENAYNAELANQKTHVRITYFIDDGDLYTSDLAEALKRRVARNLAMRGVPLAVLQGDESSPVFITRLDSEIRRYEGPYKKLVIG
jgi:hypothetical protein